MPRLLVLLLPLSLFLGCVASPPPVSQRFETFVTADEVAAMTDRPGVVIVDARSPAEFAAGHLPGAVNLPPGALRSTAVDPNGKNLMFRLGGAGPEEGRIDRERYAEIFGGAGISACDTVIAYGSHAGKDDGSVVLMILDLAGHRGPLRFLDGVGVEQWIASGRAPKTGPGVTPTPVAYESDPREGGIWTASDVLKRLGDPEVILWDTRSTDEFTGVNPRKNARGGHLPGAKLLDYAALLDAERGVKPADQVRAEREAAGVAPADLAQKTVVLYCQSATRVSLPYLLLREEKAERVAVFDGSMQEWLNDERYPVVEGETAP